LPALLGNLWQTTGYLGDKSIYERAIRKGALSEKAMIALLQRLASRHLSEDEIVSSSLKKDDHGYCSALEIHRSRGGRDALMTTTGSGHYYTALVEKAEAKPPKRGHYKNRQQVVENNDE
jgi:hypothetical protein